MDINGGLSMNKRLLALD
jgi:Holliday junction resolvasome RuvABC endonuclease subunit